MALGRSTPVCQISRQTGRTVDRMSAESELNKPELAQIWFRLGPVLVYLDSCTVSPRATWALMTTPGRVLLSWM